MHASIGRRSSQFYDRGGSSVFDQAISRSSWPDAANSRTYSVVASAVARAVRSAEVKPSFCQNGPDRRLNSHAVCAPAVAASEMAKRASASPWPSPRSRGSTATLRMSACRRSALSSNPVLPTISAVAASRATQSRTDGESRPLTVRSATRRNCVRSARSSGVTGVSSRTPPA
jgi:hypothetical protein